jgi:hypothetical protein
VVCWGQDVAGDLVIGDDESPAQAGLIDVESLAQIGTRGIAGRRSDGTVWRWELPSLVSQEVPLSGIAAALADECALMSTGSVRCWATSGWSGCGHAVCSPSEDVPIFEAE